MPTKHTVDHGEWVAKIAASKGLTEKKVWDDPANATLQKSRPNPNLLFKGDKLQIPDTQTKEDSGATEKRHRFHLKSEKAKLHLKLEHYIDEVLETDYVLKIGGKEFKGKSRGGDIEHEIPITSENGELLLPALNIQIAVRCGHQSEIEPWKSDACHYWGTQARCNNLAFDAGPVDGINGPKTKAGTEHFQSWAEMYHAKVGLAQADLSKVDGIPGPKTARCLKQVEGV